MTVPYDISIVIPTLDEDTALAGRRSLGNRVLALGYMFGLSPARLARWHGT